MLAAHLDRWFDRFPATAFQHDALALAAALQLPYVGFARERVVLDALGRMTAAPEGHVVRLSVSADYRAFRGWLARGFDAALGRNR
ncbi:hypothetical protein [Actinokineospora iranica]|uniref:Uncharacterized protein n=1 Tax=Actinokineospora iranica TaxID=1271860 RepID=A0A1G6VAD3_9PSEU|nr:hypothetical protein [Actinokineospora iranica]SDD50528.1 hypothetical protein SAMN05216174_11223 [Actinokineospora iranica]